MVTEHFLDDVQRVLVWDAESLRARLECVVVEFKPLVQMCLTKFCVSTDEN